MEAANESGQNCQKGRQTRAQTVVAADHLAVAASAATCAGPGQEKYMHVASAWSASCARKGRFVCVC